MLLVSKRISQVKAYVINIQKISNKLLKRFLETLDKEEKMKLDKVKETIYLNEKFSKFYRKETHDNSRKELENIDIEYI